MMTDMEYVLETMKRFGKVAAQNLQDRSSTMDGTQLYAEEEYIPSFAAAVAKQNMLTRKAGETDGFICKSSAGRVVRLIQNYDSETYTKEPEELPAQWRFVWSKDPQKALPFIAVPPRVMSGVLVRMSTLGHPELSECPGRTLALWKHKEKPPL